MSYCNASMAVHRTGTAILLSIVSETPNTILPFDMFVNNLHFSKAVYFLNKNLLFKTCGLL